MPEEEGITRRRACTRWQSSAGLLLVMPSSEGITPHEDRQKFSFHLKQTQFQQVHGWDASKQMKTEKTCLEKGKNPAKIGTSCHTTKIASPGNKILPPYVEGRFCFRTYPPWTQKNFHLGFMTWNTAVWWPSLWTTECWRNSARGMPIWCIGGRATQTTCTLSLNFTATA